MATTKRTLVVVCRGNIARSPFASEVINQELARCKRTEELHAVSCGVQGTRVDPVPVKHPNITHYPAMYKPVKALLAELKIDLSTHVSRPIDEQMATQASILIAMDDQTKHALLKLFPREARKIYLFTELLGGTGSITDPDKVAESAQLPIIFTDLHRRIKRGLPKLLTVLENM